MFGVVEVIELCFYLVGLGFFLFFCKYIICIILDKLNVFVLVEECFVVQCLGSGIVVVVIVEGYGVWKVLVVVEFFVGQVFVGCREFFIDVCGLVSEIWCFVFQESWENYFW